MLHLCLDQESQKLKFPLHHLFALLLCQDAINCLLLWSFKTQGFGQTLPQLTGEEILLFTFINSIEIVRPLLSLQQSILTLLVKYLAL